MCHNAEQTNTCFSASKHRSLKQCHVKSRVILFSSIIIGYQSDGRVTRNESRISMEENKQHLTVKNSKWTVMKTWKFVVKKRFIPIPVGVNEMHAICIYSWHIDRRISTDNRGQDRAREVLESISRAGFIRWIYDRGCTRNSTVETRLKSAWVESRCQCFPEKTRSEASFGRFPAIANFVENHKRMLLYQQHYRKPRGTRPARNLCHVGCDCHNPLRKNRVLMRMSMVENLCVQRVRLNYTMSDFKGFLDAKKIECEFVAKIKRCDFHIQSDSGELVLIKEPYLINWVFNQILSEGGINPIGIDSVELRLERHHFVKRQGDCKRHTSENALKRETQRSSGCVMPTCWRSVYLTCWTTILFNQRTLHSSWTDRQECFTACQLQGIQCNFIVAKLPIVAPLNEAYNGPADHPRRV